jgi:hypothetical protein
MRLYTALPAMSDLAASRRYQDPPRDAERILARALNIRIRVLGPSHRETFSSMVELASVYHDQKRWREAAALDITVMEERVRSPGTHILIHSLP